MSMTIHKLGRRCPVCPSLCAVESTSRGITQMEDPLELTPPPSLGNLPASLPFAISLERGCEADIFRSLLCRVLVA